MGFIGNIWSTSPLVLNYVEIHQVDLATKIFITEMHKKNKENSNETGHKRSEK